MIFESGAALVSPVPSLGLANPGGLVDRDHVCSEREASTRRHRDSSDRARWDAAAMARPKRDVASKLGTSVGCTAYNKQPLRGSMFLEDEWRQSFTTSAGNHGDRPSWHQLSSFLTSLFLFPSRLIRTRTLSSLSLSTPSLGPSHHGHQACSPSVCPGHPPLLLDNKCPSSCWRHLLFLV